jgi:hypothetical protein
MDHEGNTRRLEGRDRRNKRLGEDAYAKEKKIQRNTQSQYADFVRRYRHLHDYVESIAQQVDAGRRVSPSQAATLREIAAENGWIIHPIAPRQRRSRRGRKRPSSGRRHPRGSNVTGDPQSSAPPAGDAELDASTDASTRIIRSSFPPEKIGKTTTGKLA